MGQFPRKVLVSPGYGAGWSSWCYNYEAAQFAAEYKPIIKFLENGGDKNSKEFHELVENLENELADVGVDFYTGGARQLEVREVSGPYRITDYDGSESLIEQDDTNLWFY
jgi:hypothetical protein